MTTFTSNDIWQLWFVLQSCSCYWNKMRFTSDKGHLAAVIGVTVGMWQVVLNHQHGSLQHGTVMNCCPYQSKQTNDSWSISLTRKNFKVEACISSHVASWPGIAAVWIYASSITTIWGVGRRGGVLHQIIINWVQHAIKNGPNRI